MTDGHTQIVLCWPESRLWAIYNEKGFLHKIHAAGPETAYAQFVLDEDENVIKATFRGTGVNMATITYNKEGYATDVSFSHKAFGNWPWSLESGRLLLSKVMSEKYKKARNSRCTARCLK